MKGEFENYKEDIDVEKKDSIIKRILEKLETNDAEKYEENKTKCLYTMKVNYDMAIIVNNELNVKVDDQQVDMKHSKEQWNIDYEDKVQKTTVARTPWKSASLCVTCYQTFVRETVPSQTSDMGKKTVSVLAPSFLLP